MIITTIGIIHSWSLGKSTISSKSIYMWGDSQLYQGVNVNKLSMITKREVFSLAQHGSGVYDLMVFSSHVPNGSTVLLQIPKGAQKRKLSLDRNDSGLSLFAFKVLWENNYSIPDLFYIFRKNIFSVPQFNKYSDSWAYHEKLQDNLHKKLMFESYKNIPSFIFDKQNIILAAINTLVSKNCKILMIEIPMHSMLDEMESKSELKGIHNSFSKEIIKELNLTLVDSVNLESEKNIFYDLTHFNIVGNKMLTDSLAVRLKNLESVKYIKFKL
tara:strand:+ start:1554 stop:2366 length:813 start_codon:yes stop_codon:yes gene_type:complete